MNKTWVYVLRVMLLMFIAALVACSSLTPRTETEEVRLDSAFVDSGVYMLTNKLSSKVLGIPNTNLGVQLRQHTRSNPQSQQWKLEMIDADWIKITSQNGYAASAETTVNGGKVTMQVYNSNSPLMQWRLVAVSGGYYEIINRATGGRLEVGNFSTAEGALVQTWTRASVDSQKWKLEKLSTVTVTSDYQYNLRLITSSTVRNRNLDNSRFLYTPMVHLPIDSASPLLGSRTDYIRGDDGSVPGAPGGNPEPGFPARNAGTFRTSCEFSHFAYDDPLVHPNKPGAAHLHMFWGNTHTNAYSSYNSLRNSGSSTCNGMELNRTGYWAPAMFDAQGNVRIPERIIVYYKGYGLANGKAQVYPPKAAMIIDDKIHRTDNGAGGAEGQMNFECTNQFRGVRSPSSMNIPVCKDDGTIPFRRTLEMHVKFPNCWNGLDAANPKNWVLARYGSWFYSNCEYDGNKTFPNIHYIIAYPLEPGETTAGWYLSSDVDPMTRQRTKEGGSSIHADWWGAWHPTINKRWIDNCVNLKKDFDGDGLDDVDHGCGFGYLTDGGPDDNNPLPGPALKYRQQYTGPIKVPASTLYQQLCPGGAAISTATAAAYCKPATSTSSAVHSHH